MKKYITPKYAKESIETKDVITLSANEVEVVTEENGVKNANYKIDVNKLL